MIGSLIIISIVIIAIVLIMNYKPVVKLFEKIKSKIKVWNWIINIFMVLIVIAICITMVNKVKDTIDEVQMENEMAEDKANILEHQKEEQKYYNSVMAQEYDEQKYDEPYIIKGYEYVEGTWDTGYVIQDSDGNQYVWVPCTNEDIEGITKLAKRNFSNNPWMSKDLCYDTEYEEFLASALKYGGFYISRYETGIEDDEPVSKYNAVIWTNITKDEVEKVINEMNDNEQNATIQLMNSYAYDTAFEWIKNTNDVETTITDGVIYSGTKSYNNIYDLYDTTYEMTTEIYMEGRTISRGVAGMYKEIRDEYNYSLDNRTSLIFEKSESLAFRTILYKN